ncbi:polynucleotide kinase-phosphatase [Nocardiopsis changdeensis]|uniref:Polynucleotide kinase-phosphatase n=1 Tax=Nocardiopsis changdeensis TaxID=2831969 RepID=A0ABX8BPK2_9ACTN|nr:MULTISPECIES: polynucleotide kinase-phosphatase [Nocardiopsis]QUX23628.1 polynucleotide kinase-phosphatase [Nocardiopsis changdeensis]QYX39572.1 polynucleotide kinase-phosphatase [Nocardiopsis sp. MT53]
MNTDETAPDTAPRVLGVPAMGLVVLVGVSGSGKSTFAARHFKPTEVISSDFCRGLVSDDENDQGATADAFSLLHTVLDIRLRRGLLTVVDATNVQSKARAELLAVAKANNVLSTAIVLDVPEALAKERNRTRPDRDFGDHVIPRQRRDLRRSLKYLRKEGFRKVHVLKGVEEIDAAVIERERAWPDKRELTGPFDIIGDVHGCREELEELLTSLGYGITRDDRGRAVGARHPQGRTAVFVGDLVDRGPDTPGVLRLAMGMVRDGDALCVPGNHENKLIRALRGVRVTATHGLAESLEQLGRESEEFRREVLDFCDGLVSHLVLDGGRLVVAHAGLKEAYHGRASGRVRSFALYGDTTGETDEYGLPVRLPWARDYRGRAAVVYGHTPVLKAEWVNNTLCLDTGCVFGGKLTALRYPEREIVDVDARRTWYEPVRPLGGEAPAGAEGGDRSDTLVDITDVGVGDHHPGLIVETEFGTVRANGASALGALEVMSRFSVDPRWLLYLPPTMAPAPTAAAPGYLEHPDEAFAWYRAAGVGQVVCEEKHMGSRAVAVLCRDEAAAERRFAPGALGTVYTRTGRPFFADPVLRGEVVDRLRAAVTGAGLWDRLGTDWVALDGELLPWSAKARTLIRDQYASVGAAARAALPAAGAALAAAAERGLDVGRLVDRVTRSTEQMEEFSRVYRRYSWDTDGAAGLRFAPFAVLASEGREYSDADHLWHMATAERLAEADPLVRSTRYRVVDTTDPAACASAAAWWQEMVDAGGEGMVVKPLQGARATGAKGLTQPGLKVRGPEYLRIIYGHDYTDPDRLEVLKDRRLGGKLGLAMREHKLGLEALARHARREPLWRVHEPVFAALALETEPVDPRL